MGEAVTAAELVGQLRLFTGSYGSAAIPTLFLTLSADVDTGYVTSVKLTDGDLLPYCQVGGTFEHCYESTIWSMSQRLA